jgi:zinc protease
MEATPTGMLRRDLAQQLHSGDERWAMPSDSTIATSKIADLKTMLTDQLSHGPIEVVMVGDVDVEQAIAATAATLGALHRDPAAQAPPPESREVVFPKPQAEPIIERHKGRADQAVAALAWPTNDFYADMREARVLTVLSQVMQLRMIDDLRVQKGDTYSPSAGLNPSQTYPGYGYLLANVEIPPAKVGAFFTEVQKIAQDLRTQPVSQDELTRAVLPLVDQLSRSRQSNQYWVGALTGAQTDPRRLDAVRSQIAQYQQVSAADIQKAAQKYLIPEKAWKFEVLPEPTIAEAAPAAGQSIATK